jgi:hypothetical protein
MSTIVTRSGKGSPLTHTEVDNNFTNLNTDKVETSGGTLTNPTINGTVTTTGLNFDSNTLIIDATNNRVGVGTASPAYTLDALGSVRLKTGGTGTPVIVSTGGDSQGTLRFGSTSTEYSINGGADYLSLRFNTNSAERMRITSDGNVGIGTSSPSSKLTVAGAATATTNTILANGTTTGANFWRITNTGGDGVLGVEGSTNSGICTDSTAYSTLLYTVGATSLQFGTNSLVRATLNSSGNLGLGVTPSAWGSNYRSLDMFATEGASFSSGAGAMEIATNAYNNSGWKYKNTSTIKSCKYTQYDGAHQWFYAPTGTAGNAITFTQAMTLDASGNLGIGTTSPSSYNSSARQLVIANASASTGMTIRAGGGGAANIIFSNAEDTGADGLIQYEIASNFMRFDTSGSERMRIDSSGNVGIGTISPARKLEVKSSTSSVNYVRLQENTANTPTNGGSMLELCGTRSNGGVGFYGGIFGGRQNASANNAGYLAFYADNNDGQSLAERMRINSSGQLFVGTTTAIQSAEKMAVLDTSGNNALFTKQEGGSGGWCAKFWNNATSGSNNLVEFITETSLTARGSITYNRGAGLVAYNVTSDYRAKDIISNTVNSGEIIDSVPVYMGKMKDATQTRPMFIAHETPDYAHTGEKDAVDKDGNPIYQQMDASSLVPVLWAEIQSLRKRVALLESK